MKKQRILVWVKRYWWTVLLSILIFSTLILITISVSYFYENFNEVSISKSPSEWGVFGDYFGGVLNPLLALINICITIWLTIIINRFAKKNNDSQIDSARKIALIQLKHDALHEFRTELNGYFNLWKNSILSVDHAKSCQQTLHNFQENYDYLFNFVEIRSFAHLTNIINDAVFSIENDRLNIRSGVQNYMQSNMGRQALLADLGNRTIE